MINIDTVYQRVLALANKEQRGYITPQEFNLLANQAQMTIFESYFYTKNQREELDKDRRKANDGDNVTETDITELMDKKLKHFTSLEPLQNLNTTYPLTVDVNGVDVDVFQTGRMWHNGRVCRYIHPTEAFRLIASTRHIVGGRDPFFTDSFLDGQDVLVYNPAVSGAGILISGVNVECIRVPLPAYWAYVVVNEKALFNTNTATHFELHRAEEDTLVNKILELAGVVMNKPGLVQIAAQKDSQELSIQNV